MSSTPLAEPAARAPEVWNWREAFSKNRGTLLGTFDLRMPCCGLWIRGCMLHAEVVPPGALRVALPGAALLRNGELWRDELSGKLQYKTILSFDDTEVYRAFQAPILERLRDLGHV